eukprot:TRINITY_DN16116_c0_g1_i1.p1 TRINITY_DN16116_c0_g1~~TRINITY_DN16116_c0_g1_i1.p1  ORF type:complete len:379 (+),score=104.67 TRINITY_DN16116_c0_g1_i1:68-1138(+)
MAAVPPAAPAPQGRGLAPTLFALVLSPLTAQPARAKRRAAAQQQQPAAGGAAAAAGTEGGSDCAPAADEGVGAVLATLNPAERTRHRRVGRVAARVVLVRAAQKLSDVDPSMLAHTPNWRIPLTESGKRQALALGRRLAAECRGGPVYFFVSPYERSKQTYFHIRRGMGKGCKVGGAREEPRLSDQQRGNYMNAQSLPAVNALQQRYGRFFFRFREGESASDVYARVGEFVDDLYEEIAPYQADLGSAVGGGRAPQAAGALPGGALPQPVRSSDATVVMVTHGATLRCFLMRWFGMSVEDFERMADPPPGECVVLSRDASGCCTSMDERSKRLVSMPPFVSCAVHGTLCRIGKVAR